MENLSPVEIIAQKLFSLFDSFKPAKAKENSGDTDHTSASMDR